MLELTQVQSDLLPIAECAINVLEHELLKMPQADIVTSHKFLPGIYERTIIIPPNTVLTGAVHKTCYTVRLEKGSIAVNKDDRIEILSAPCIFSAKAGAKRVGLTLSETVVWTDIYENSDDCLDIQAIESRLYELDGIELGETRRIQSLTSNHIKYYRLFSSHVSKFIDYMRMKAAIKGSKTWLVG